MQRRHINTVPSSLPSLFARVSTVKIDSPGSQHVASLHPVEALHRVSPSTATSPRLHEVSPVSASTNEKQVVSLGSAGGDDVGAGDVRTLGDRISMVGVGVGARANGGCVGGIAVGSTVGTGVVSTVDAGAGEGTTVEWTRDRVDKERGHLAGAYASRYVRSITRVDMLGLSLKKVSL